MGPSMNGGGVMAGAKSGGPLFKILETLTSDPETYKARFDELVTKTAQMEDAANAAREYASAAKADADKAAEDRQVAETARAEASIFNEEIKDERIALRAEAAAATEKLAVERDSLAYLRAQFDAEREGWQVAHATRQASLDQRERDTAAMRELAVEDRREAAELREVYQIKVTAIKNAAQAISD